MKHPRSSPPPRTMRKRQKAEKIKRLDESVIRHARARRLEALENDNDAQQREAQILEGEDEYQPGMHSDDELPTSKRKKKKRRTRRSRAAVVQGKPPKGIDRFNKSVAAVLEEETGLPRVNGMVGLHQITARPSRFSERRFCSICGYEAKYTCLTCAARFCSIPCGQVHQETRCLKFMA